MKKIISIFIISFLAANTYGQEYLTINPNARTSAMGDASVAVTGDAWSVFGNAAAPLFEYKNIQAQFSYTPWQSDVAGGYYLLSLGGYVKISDRHALSVGGRMYQEPKLTEVSAGWDNYPFVPKDENNNPIHLKTTRPNGKALDVAYGYKVCDKVGLSLTARYGHYATGIGSNSNTIGFDLAVYSSLPLNILDGAKINIGAKAANLGFSFGDIKSDLPISGKVGASLYAPFSDAHALEGTVDLGYMYQSESMKTFMANVGVEYTLMQLLAVRAGYGYNYYGYATVGLGLRFMHIQIDASYWVAAKSCPWRNTFRVGVGIDF
ncbi:MAG: PorV/PorQ family protein [Alistipes sp.]|nr:PorV/PorQ family protein [Alistipes sp.]